MRTGYVSYASAIGNSGYPLDHEPAEETCRAAYFAGTVASGGYCTCLSSTLTCLAFTKSQM